MGNSLEAKLEVSSGAYASIWDLCAGYAGQYKLPFLILPVLITMSTRRDHPEELFEFETIARTRMRYWVLGLMGVWLAMATFDWTSRFLIFHWQDQWLSVRSVSETSSHTRGIPQSHVVPAKMGGGLTRMVPVRRIAVRYAEFHPEHIQTIDEWGYMNDSSSEGMYYPVVTLGDSVMVSLGTQNVAQVLSIVGGVPVYNHARAGTGPFLEMRRFLSLKRFVPMPKVVVWNISARELGAPLFLRQPVVSWFSNPSFSFQGSAATSSGIQWSSFTPSSLGTAWPNTSLMAYLGRRGWSKVKLAVFQEWPSDVFGADDPQFGPMLFYGENLRVLPLLTPEVDAPAVIQTVVRVAEGFRELGMELVVLLVPEKEQVHIQALPPGQQIRLAKGPELLQAIEQGLTSHDVPVVNLLPVFQRETASGNRLFWRDDTHWNDEGIHLAAKEIWRTVEPLLE